MEINSLAIDHLLMVDHDALLPKPLLPTPYVSPRPRKRQFRFVETDMLDDDDEP